MLETLHLPADITSPRRARQFVDEVLHRWHRDGAIDRLALIASELVTNAVRYAPSEIGIDIEARDSSLYLEVFDGGADRPRFRDGDSDGPGGLGLPIVEALAASWGIRQRDGGKGVWVEVPG